MSKKEAIITFADMVRGVPLEVAHSILTGLRNMDPRGPEKVIEAAQQRNQQPDLVRMPGWDLLHFPKQGGQDHLGFSTIGQLNPEPVNIGDDVTWKYPQQRWLALTANINTKTGEVCEGAACVPMSTYAAAGGQTKYETIKDSLRELSITDGIRQQEDYIDEYGEEAAMEIGGDWDFLQAEPDLENEGVRPDIAETFIEYGGWAGDDFYRPLPLQEFHKSGEGMEIAFRIAHNLPSAIMSMRTAANDVNPVYHHSVGFYEGLQGAPHPSLVYSPENTLDITNLYAPMSLVKRFETYLEGKKKFSK